CWLDPGKEAQLGNEEEVERSWMDCFHERLDFFGLLRTGCKKHIGARLRVRLEPPHRLAEGIGIANVVALNSCSEQHSTARSINGFSRRLQTIIQGLASHRGSAVG